jgi:hypothetical protein
MVMPQANESHQRGQQVQRADGHHPIAPPQKHCGQ